MQLLKLSRKDDIWQAGSSDLVVSSMNLKVWVAALSVPDLVRWLLALLDLGRWCGFPLAFGQGVSSEHGIKRVKVRAWFNFRPMTGWDPMDPGRWRYGGSRR